MQGGLPCVSHSWKLVWSDICPVCRNFTGWTMTSKLMLQMYASGRSLVYAPIADEVSSTLVCIGSIAHVSYTRIGLIKGYHSHPCLKS